jgi:hypothetical protein
VFSQQSNGCIRATCSSTAGSWFLNAIQLPTPAKNGESVLKMVWEGQVNYLPESGKFYIIGFEWRDASDDFTFVVELFINSAGMSYVRIYNGSYTTVSLSTLACDIWTNITQLTFFMFYNIDGTSSIGHRGKIHRNGLKLHMWEHRKDSTISSRIPNGIVRPKFYFGRDTHNIIVDTYEFMYQGGI